MLELPGINYIILRLVGLNASAKAIHKLSIKPDSNYKPCFIHWSGAFLLYLISTIFMSDTTPQVSSPYAQFKISDEERKIMEEEYEHLRKLLEDPDCPF